MNTQDFEDVKALLHGVTEPLAEIADRLADLQTLVSGGATITITIKVGSD